MFVWVNLRAPHELIYPRFFLLSAQATRAIQIFTKLTKRSMTCIDAKTPSGVAGAGSYPEAYAARAKPSTEPLLTVPEVGIRINCRLSEGLMALVVY